MSVDACVGARAQVTPPVTAAEGGQGASLLWWAQEVAPDQALWALAKDASAAVKKETEAKGGLAFWVRAYFETPLPLRLMAGDA